MAQSILVTRKTDEWSARGFLGESDSYRLCCGQEEFLSVSARARYANLRSTRLDQRYAAVLVRAMNTQMLSCN